MNCNGDDNYGDFDEDGDDDDDHHHDFDADGFDDDDDDDFDDDDEMNCSNRSCQAGSLLPPESPS